MEALTPVQQLFQKIVEAYDLNDGPWKGSYAHGLFDAFVLITGEDPDVALEEMFDAVQTQCQCSHDEMLASMEMGERCE